MNEETKEKKATKERIIVLEEGKGVDGAPNPGLLLGICCPAPYVPIRFW